MYLLFWLFMSFISTDSVLVTPSHKKKEKQKKKNKTEWPMLTQLTPHWLAMTHMYADPCSIHFHCFCFPMRRSFKLCHRRHIPEIQDKEARRELCQKSLSASDKQMGILVSSFSPAQEMMFFLLWTIWRTRSLMLKTHQSNFVHFLSEIPVYTRNCDENPEISLMCFDNHETKQLNISSSFSSVDDKRESRQSKLFIWYWLIARRTKVKRNKWRIYQLTKKIINNDFEWCFFSLLQNMKTIDELTSCFLRAAYCHPHRLLGTLPCHPLK